MAEFTFFLFKNPSKIFTLLTLVSSLPPTTKILIIAGLDPSGCAGLAADVKTCMALNAYSLPVITTVTAQNTQQVASIHPVPMETIRAQFDAVVADIQIDAVKIGLLTESTNFVLLASLLVQARLTNIVVDPVLRSTTGFTFGNETVLRAYREVLFPVADVITPNIDEASALSGIAVTGISSMKDAAQRLHAFGSRNVVITGGHLPGNATDVLFDGTAYELFESPKIEPVQVRGLGCTFSAALAVHLANGKSLPEAIRASKEFIANAMQHPLNIGHGRGALNHRRGR